MPYFVYLLKCVDKSIYTGITTDVKRRLAEHKNKKGGHYTSSHRVIKILHTEKYPTRSAAARARSRNQELVAGKEDDVGATRAGVVLK